MAATTEFPNNCLTNTIILQDFGEIAYIVCTVAIPPTSHAAQVPPETTLARLKQTEAQFRHASILAALEVDSMQLFTFYKKIDVMKDQRTLLSKFGNILRNNSCTIAYKAAAKAQDLFKPENARLYRLFLSSILVSIELPPQEGCQILPLGERYYALEGNTSQVIRDSIVPKGWSLVRIDLQLVPPGHVLLIAAVDHFRTLFTVADVHWQWRNTPKVQQNIPVVLAPFGQLATYQGGWIGPWTEYTFDKNNPPPEMRVRLKQWRQMLAERLRTDSVWPFQDADDATWVELRIPRAIGGDGPFRESENGLLELMKSLEFDQIYWPAALCFILRNTAAASPPDKFGLEDPVKFVQDWVSSAAERLAELEAEILKSPSEEDELALFGDEGSFENPEGFPPFGPPTFPTSQMVYPTPPDVVMTHATPGMSSMDGMVMTPAHAHRSAGEPLQASTHELEMIDLDPTQVAAVGSGYYAEDLFEEMPDDNFGPTGGGEEPNWDFFDKPDMDLDDAEIRENRGDNSTCEHAPADEGTEGHKSFKSDQNHSDTQSPTREIAAAPTSLARLSSSAADRRQHKDVQIELAADGELPASTDHVACNSDVSMDQEAKRTDSRFQRRRSSPSEMSPFLKHPAPQDLRYRTQGSFWFDMFPNLTPMNPSHNLAGWLRRTPSTSSASDSTGGEHGTSSTGDADTPHLERQWTFYEPVLPDQDKPLVQINTAAIEEEVREIFDHVKIRSATLSLENIVHFPRKQNSGLPKDKPGHILMFSQLFVDQYAQSTLMRCLQRDRSAEPEARLLTDVIPDLSNLNVSATYANIGQLASIGAIAGGQPSCERVVKLPERQIKFKRGEKHMLASMSILPFWDTLELQPQSQPKDITAFCIHPPGSGIGDGCATFLDRIADAYTNCSLGAHKTGAVPKIAERGLLTWSAEREKTASFIAAAMRLGEALTLTDEIQGTVVLYIIGISADPGSYLQCCIAFYACFQSYRKKMGNRPPNFELVLQVIPAAFVASTETIVVPGQSDYNYLALEVYGRLPPSEAKSPPGACDFPILLADAMDSVRFHLEAKLVSPLSNDGICLHLAYAHSDDQRWIVACWTNETGELALTMTYLLRTTANDRGRLENDVIKDMWDVSQELMKPHRSRWRIVVSRIGFCDLAEENCWMQIASAAASDGKESCTLQLLSIELSPTIQISIPALHWKAGQMYTSGQANTYGTPASTPQAISTSPEQLVPATPTPGGTSALNAPTPPEHGFDANIDGDLNLTDPTEESWAVVLPFGVNQGHDILTVRPSKVQGTSGYLLKRLGPKDEDGLTSIGVHLIYTRPAATGAVQGQKEEVLEDIIRQFRGLSTLAVARGCIDKSKQYVPWHIHIAVTGARGLVGLV